MKHSTENWYPQNYSQGYRFYGTLTIVWLTT
nr:MAG TPA: hypothetical protein [Bacteriophage sp.]